MLSEMKKKETFSYVIAFNCCFGENRSVKLDKTEIHILVGSVRGVKILWVHVYVAGREHEFPTRHLVVHSEARKYVDSVFHMGQNDN